MNSTEFCFWLQGYLELREDDEPLTAKQVKVVQDHLALVFAKVTPDRDEEPDVWPGDPQPTGATLCEPRTVAPPIQPTVVPDQLDFEKIVREIQEKSREAQRDHRVYCSGIPLSGRGPRIC